MGKSSINGPFSMAMLNNQMVSIFPFFAIGSHWSSKISRPVRSRSEMLELIATTPSCQKEHKKQGLLSNVKMSMIYNIIYIYITHLNHLNNLGVLSMSSSCNSW